MEQLYAQALYRMMEDGTSPKEAIKKLRVVLERHGRIALLPRIARALMRIVARESAKNKVGLTVAHKKDERSAQNAVKAILKEIGVSPKDVEVVLDESLVGGWRLEGKERLVDASFKKDLLSLYNRVTQ